MLTLRSLQSFTAQRNNSLKIKSKAVGKSGCLFAYIGIVGVDESPKHRLYCIAEAAIQECGFVTKLTQNAFLLLKCTKFIGLYDTSGTICCAK